MPMKGMRSIFSKTSTPSSSPPPSYKQHHHQTFTETMIDENIEIAQLLINKWNIDSYDHYSHVLNSLFSGDRREAKEYLKSVQDLQSAMHFFVTEHSSSDKLIRAQHLMQMAMKRLEKEFYHILSSNRDYLDPESVSSRSSRASPRSSVSRASPRSSVSEENEFKLGDESPEPEDDIKSGSESISEGERVSNMAMFDLKAIADCMISSGYGKECVKIYIVIRKSIIDEGLYHLGVERLNFSQIQKMEWEIVEPKIKRWLHAVKVAMKTLFYGERILCDHVFQSSPAITESCFSEISKEGALSLFGFPELFAKCKKSPEKMFRTLDLYETISELWPEIESIFAYESTSVVKSQAIASLNKLGEAVRITLIEFEAAIQKESSKAPVPGGGIHPITRYVMNYLSFLSEYSGILTDMALDWPTETPSRLKENDDSLSSVIPDRIAWLVLVLLCKLDVKAELHKDVALSYLFLANNLQYVVVKVRKSNLKFLLGDEWLAKQELQIKQYATNYERMGWNKVFASLPENPSAECSPEMARNYFRRFNLTFEEVYRKQSGWIVPDSKLRDEIKVSIAKKIMPIYREFYAKWRVTVSVRKEMNNDVVLRFAPDDLENYLSDLFHGGGVSGGDGSTATHHTPRHK